MLWEKGLKSSLTSKISLFVAKLPIGINHNFILGGGGEGLGCLLQKDRFLFHEQFSTQNEWKTFFPL